MSNDLGKVTIIRDVNAKEILGYYIKHAKEISIRANMGNLAAQRVHRRGKRLTKCQCNLCLDRMVEAIDIFRLSTLN